jgi:hypothetical protein
VPEAGSNEASPPRPTPYLSHDGWASPGRDFIPVELLGQVVTPRQPDATRPTAGEPAPPALPLIAADADESWAERTSLFGEAEG